MREKGVLTLLERCRTAAMGGHKEACEEGHFERYAYNSCGNSHCPKCQSLATEHWLLKQARRLLDVLHFHVVFTLVPELRALARRHPKVVYGALMRAAAETLLTLSRKRKGVLPGLIAILHTWTRELGFHPHVHFVVTAGGLGLKQEGFLHGRSDYLFPVKMMGKVFRGKMLDLLDRQWRKQAFPELDEREFRSLMAAARSREWVVYAKKPLGCITYVIEYFARYARRVGIANSRLLAVTDDKVTFRTKGRKTITLHPVEFLRRFLLHILPQGFHKVRHYGLYASTGDGGLLEQARAILDRRCRRSPGRRMAFIARAEARLRRLEKKTRCCPICRRPLDHLPLEASDARSPPEAAV